MSSMVTHVTSRRGAARISLVHATFVVRGDFKVSAVLREGTKEEETDEKGGGREREREKTLLFCLKSAAVNFSAR